MRTVTAKWKTLIAYTHPMVTIVESWRGGVQLAGSVPIQSGSLQYDATGVLQRRAKLTVPARTPERRWDPAGNPSHPLANYGQQLHVRTGIRHPDGSEEVLDHGWYLLTSWSRDEDNGTLQIEATDLAQFLVDDPFTVPSTPPRGTSYRAEFTRLVGNILPVVIDPGLADRGLSTTVIWPREREQALSDLCDSWPARWYVGDDGAVHAATPYTLVTDSTPPDIVLTDGGTGTVSGRARKSERGALSNVVVVDGKANDDGTAGPHAEKAITSASSPVRADGPYKRVTRFYASDLITTQAQANATADAMLVNYSTAGRAEGVAAVPDPSIQLGDVGRVYTRDGDAYTGRITAIELPLTPDDAPMQATIAMLPAGTIDGAGDERSV